MTRDLKPIWMLLGGSVLLLAALAMLATNESNVLAYRAAAMRHGGVVMNATRSGPTPSNNGEMVLVSGVPKIVKPAVDPWFGIHASVPILWRVTDMFQWRQIDYAGSISYELEWADHPVDSSGFKHPAYHRNPTQMPFGGERFLAQEVRLDGFLLGSKLVLAMPGREDITPDFSSLRPNMAASFRPYHGALLTSRDPASPQLGDVRVRWQGAPDQPVTIIAMNQDGTLTPAVDVQDGAGYQLQVGRLQVDDLQPDLPSQPYLPWLWRVLSGVLAVLGAFALMHMTPLRGSAVLPACGIAITLVCGLAGVMWISARTDVGTLLIGAGLLSLGITAWRLYQRNGGEAPPASG